MRNKLFFKLFIVGCILISSACIILNIPIFEISSSYTDNTYVNSSENSICVLKYTYTTGAGWVVTDSDIDSLVGENICLSYRFDPRLLRDNEDFSLDYQGKMVVSIDKINKIVMDNEDVFVISPEKIKILYNTDKKEYRIKDMSFGGIVKSIMSLFNKKYSYSY